MYGSLSVVRTLYSTVTVWDSRWEEITRDIIRLCYSIWATVSCVVVSDSPEGHLPSDHTRLPAGSNTTNLSREIICTITSDVIVKDVFPEEIALQIVDELVDSLLGCSSSNPVMDGESCADIEEIEQDLGQMTVKEESDDEEELSAGTKVKEVSSQMLLLCSWRCVKEISLFLSELCSTYKQDEVNIITVKQILEVSNFLLDLLTDTKHRGAFEQAFVAFSSLCSFLWRCPQPQLHSQPQTMLEDTLDSVTGVAGSTRPSLCSTRRSAGVPFILQAVITSALQSSGSVLRLTMERLLGTARNPGETESRLHCLNILRALFRDAKLGENITSFVEDGVKVAVTGFKSSSWAERNASTLLFSALMTRVFGVKREKTSLSSKNCLTGKIFFQRYPSLYSFLLAQLSESDCPEQPGVLVVDSAVYPVLLILSRIFPSPAETASSPFPLSAFLPLVEKIRRSPVLQTRQLAAAALVPLLAEEEVGRYLETSLRTLQRPDLSQNSRHGLLLIISQFSAKYPAISAPLLLPELLGQTCLELLVRNNPCSLTCSTTLSLLSSLLRPDNLETFSSAGLVEALTDRLFDERETSSADPAVNIPADLWKPLLFKEAAKLLVRFSLLSRDLALVEKLLVHPEYEVRLAVSDDLRSQVELVDSKLGSFLLQLLLVEKHPECLQSLLSCCSNLSPSLPSPQLLPFLTSLMETTKTDKVKAAALLVCSNLARHTEEEEALYSLALTVRASVEPQNTKTTREAAAEVLLHNSLLLSGPGTSNRTAVLLWSSLIKLSTDDELLLRDTIARVYCKITDSASRMSASVATERMLDLMFDTLGFRSPTDCIATAVGAILGPLADREDSQELSPEVDKAFDKNEVNCYQEVVGLALLLLPRVERLVRKLSPKLQEVTFTAESVLLRELLPDLPGAVTVYNLTQLVEYLVVRLRSNQDLDSIESVLLILLLSSLRCGHTHHLLAGQLSDSMGKLKKKTHFVKTLERSLLVDLKQG